MKIQTMVYLIFAGITAASIYSYYSRKFLGDFLRKLDKAECRNEETAKSLCELGYSPVSAFLVSLSLGENSSLLKYAKEIYSADEMAVLREKDKKAAQKYFLPENVKETALKRYDCGKMKLWKLICGILVCIVTAVICANIIPYAVSMIRGVGKNFEGNNEVVGTRIEETVVTDDKAE